MRCGLTADERTHLRVAQLARRLLRGAGRLVAQNASLNSKVSQLQGELNLRESHNGLDSSENESNLRSLKKVTLPRQIVEYDENEEESSDFKLSYNRFPKNHSRRRSLQEGKSGSGKSGSGKGGTGKSSKSSKRDCSSSRTGDSEEHDLQCEGKKNRSFFQLHKFSSIRLN